MHFSSCYILLLSAASLLLACDGEDLVQSRRGGPQGAVDLRDTRAKPYPGGGGCEGCGATDSLSNGPVDDSAKAGSGDTPSGGRGDLGAVECDVWSQDCPEGEKCTAWASGGGSKWNATRCAPIDSAPVQPGEACTAEGGGVSGVDNCARSSMCWDVDSETDEGVCVSLCAGTSAEDGTCDAGLTCSIFSGGVLSLCLPGCDSLLQDCSGGSLCIPNGEGFACVLDASGDGGFFGDSCEDANSCKRGLSCLNADFVEGCEGEGCCTPFCDTSERNSCPGRSQECIPWYDGDAQPGYENVGVCGIRD